MSNKRTVNRYIDGFRTGNHDEVLTCLTDDVEWELPGAFHIKGKPAFDQHIEDEAFVGRPTITITRLTEEDDVVVAEGTVQSERRDGGVLHARFCDVFEMQGEKIRKLITYIMQLS